MVVDDLAVVVVVDDGVFEWSKKQKAKQKEKGPDSNKAGARQSNQSRGRSGDGPLG